MIFAVKWAPHMSHLIDGEILPSRQMCHPSSGHSLFSPKQRWLNISLLSWVNHTSSSIRTFSRMVFRRLLFSVFRLRASRSELASSFLTVLR